MGNRISTPTTIPTILDVNQRSTLSEIKQMYCRACFQHRNDPEMLLRINEAYEKASKEVDLDFYTTDLLDKEFVRYAPDFFKRLEQTYDIKAPMGFEDGEFGMFYRYWNTFRHEYLIIEKKVRKIINEIKKRDPRLVRRVVVQRAKKTESVTRKERPIKKWKKYCEVCQKGFNSENTYLDHERSKKHKEAVNRKGSGVPESDTIHTGLDILLSDLYTSIDTSYDDIYVNVDYTGVNTDEQDMHTDINTDDYDTHNNTDEQDTHNNTDEKDTHTNTPDYDTNTSTDEPEQNIQNDEELCDQPDGTAARLNIEHQAFRTCHRCKKIFVTRGKLILHIRNEH